MIADYAWASVASLASAVRRGEVSPVELVARALDRIEASQPTLNAFITTCPERAIEHARAAEAAVRRGDELGPLHGVPFSAKDMLDTEGVRTTFGSLALKDRVPTQDCAAVKRMKNAGAILVGKTTTPEFASGCLTESPLFGRTRNVWHPQRASGGSSGGAAVSVAAGLVPVALATDSGGSTRIPAACNAVLGMKQTLGLIPDDLTPDPFGSLVYTNPIVRRAEDLPMLFGVLAGAHPNDPLSLMANADAPPGIEAGLRGARIGWMPRLGDEVVEPEVLARCQAALDRMERSGAHVEEMKADVVPFLGAWASIQNTYRSHRFGPVMQAHADLLSPRLRRLMEGAEGGTARDLMSAMATRGALFRQVQSWFAAVDFVVTPTLTRTALPLHSEIDADVEVAGALRGRPASAWFPALGLFNLSGHPALSVPCGWASDGLPVAMQVVGPWGSDLRLARLAQHYQELHPESLRDSPASFER